MYEMGRLVYEMQVIGICVGVLMLYCFLVIDDRVIIHLVEAGAEEVCVLIGKVNELQAAINILIKLFATWVNLIGSVDMLVDDLADKLNLLVTAQFAQLGLRSKSTVNIVIDRWCQTIDNTSFLTINTHFHGNQIILTGLPPLGIIAFELHLAGFEVVAWVELIGDADRADIKLLHALEEVFGINREHLQYTRLGDIIAVFSTPLALR